MAGPSVYAAAVTSRPDVQPSFAQVWHAGTAIVAGAALTLHLVLGVANGQTALPERLLRMVSYFTFQADVLVLVGCAVLAFRPDRDSLAWRVVRLNGLVAMVVTFVIYLVLLRPTLQLTGWDAVADIGLHYLTPAFMVAGWALFGPRRRVDARVVLLALIWPVGWFAWTLLHGAVAAFYPYPFVDIRSLGYDGVLLRAGMVTTLLFATSVLAWILDRRLSVVAPHGWAPLWERTPETAHFPRP